MIDDELDLDVDEQYEGDEDYEGGSLFESEPDFEPDPTPEVDLNAPLSRAEFFEALKQFQAPQQTQQPYQQAYNEAIYDPTFEARKAIRLEDEMIAEVNAMYPDLPLDAKAEIRNRIGSYRTYDDLLAAKNGKVHELLANAKAGELLRQGKWIPASVKKMTRTEPVNTERPRPISAGKRSEIDFVNSLLKEHGIQLDETDLKRKK